MALLRREYWSALPFPPPGDLPASEAKPASPASSPLAGRFFITEPPAKSSTPLITAAAKSLQSRPTLSNPIDGSPPGSSVPGILQARTLSGLPFPSPMHACMHAKSLQSCPTLCDPIDGSPPGSSVHGIFQARTLEWGTTAFSKTFSIILNISYC